MRSKPKLPRAPLPRQTQKVHQKKSKDRKVKHRKSYNHWSDDPANAGIA